MEGFTDFGRSMGLLYDEEPRDGASRRTLPTAAGWAMAALGLLLLLIGLAAVSVLAATFSNSQRLTAHPTRDTCEIERSLDGSLDDRCAPCEQANMQRQLNDFVRWQTSKVLEVNGGFAVIGPSTRSLVDAPTNQDPMFPDVFQDTWDEIHARAAATIDPSLLDPYDAAAFEFAYLRPKFHGWYQNQTNLTDVCQKRMEDWMLNNNAIVPASVMFNTLFPIPAVATTFGPWILDTTLFNYYVDQLEQAISAIQQRTTGDWWTAVHNRVLANGGVLRSAWITNTLNAVATDLAFSDPLAAPQPIKLYIAKSNYAMTPSEEARLDDVIERYYAAQTDFFVYALSTAPAYGNPILFNTWAATYGWTACFGYTNGLWYYGTNESELMSMFLTNKAWTENLVADLLVKRNQLWPADAWMPWQDTYLHYVYPEGLPNGLGITGWGFNPAQCNVINPVSGMPLFGDTVSRSVARYYNERYKLYNAANGPTARHLVSMAYGGCAPLAGNAGTSVMTTPLTNDFVSPPVLIQQGPAYTLNFTMSVVIHEQKHAAQSAMVAGTGCPTCFGNFQTPSSFGVPVTTVSYPFSFSDFNGLAFVEGPAVFAEEQAIENGLLTEWEEFHVRMSFVQIRQMYMITTVGIRLGYWDLAGALAWMNTYSWFPSQITPAVITQGVLREMIPSAGWYGIGWWYTRMYNAMAKEACGDAFNQQAYNQLTHALPTGPIPMWRQLLDNYVANNCTSPTTRFGDARRTVVAPSLRGM